jgi:hypothetical protein
MSQPTSDQIGRFAELFAAAELIRPRDRGRKPPLFRTTHVGDKYPAVDFLVDLVGPNDVSRGFFFLQVKGTTTSNPSSNRLPLDVPRERFNALAAITAPTYLIGVDLVAAESYLVAAYRRRRSRVSSIAKAFRLNDESVRVMLYEEVLAFWMANKPLLLRTRFKDV